MATYLDRIVARHREVAANDRRRLDDLIAETMGLAPCRGFGAALAQIGRGSALEPGHELERGSELGVIAEIKRRSPSKGPLAESVDPAAIAQDYVAGGASCLSVLTDVEFFGGSPDDLGVARSAVPVPVLRKDFTVDARDVVDARLMGADAVLLIAAVLAPSELAEFHDLAVQVGLDVLVEIHDEAELAVALDAGAGIVGVNQRDLVTFEVDHERARRMGSLIPVDVVRVAESGVRGPDDAASLREAGYHAVLVGETLMRSSDRAAAVAALRRPRA
jgi:indole-3-glycerol phosphate synthase